WAEEVYSFYAKGIAGRYPFSRSGSDASLSDASDFLREGGVLWTHYQQKLAKYITRNGNRFHVEKPYDSGYSPALLRCLENAATWTSVLFPSGSQTAQITLEVRPQPVARTVSEVALEVDGVSKVYRNGPEEHWSFTWPGKGKNRGVKLAIKGANGVIDTLR